MLLIVLLLGTVPHRTLAAPIELDYMEYSSSVATRVAYVSNSSITATGGTITEVDGYRIHTFTSNGTFTIDVATNVEVLVVAGGGAGGGLDRDGLCGGGGAGGMLIGSTSVIVQGYAIVVGSGGIGTDTWGNDGENSSAFGITATGGDYYKKVKGRIDEN